LIPRMGSRTGTSGAVDRWWELVLRIKRTWLW
jgi:hypothetical protein